MLVCVGCGLYEFGSGIFLGSSFCVDARSCVLGADQSSRVAEYARWDGIENNNILYTCPEAYGNTSIQVT